MTLVYNGVRKLSSINGAGKNWIVTCKGMKLNHYLTPYTEIDLKQLKDVKPEVIKCKDNILLDASLREIIGDSILTRKAKNKWCEHQAEKLLHH